jgi:hypothetical protein
VTDQNRDFLLNFVLPVLAVLVPVYLLAWALS